MNIIVRDAVVDDLRTMARMFEKCVLNTNKRDYSKNQLEAWISRSTPSRWMELFSNFHFMIAEFAVYGEVGFISINTEGYINSLFVHHRYQRMGVGSALLAEAHKLAIANGASELSADVSITARPFYLAHGFALQYAKEVSFDRVTLECFFMTKRL